MPNTSDFDFLHIPPICYLHLPNSTGAGGAYFMARCMDCQEHGLICDADGTGIKCFNRDEDGWMIMYDHEKMELKAMLLAMNGSSMLDKWESRKVKGGDAV